MMAPKRVNERDSGLTARVPDDSGMAFTWRINGGMIQSGARSNQIRFSVGRDSVVKLSCRIVNAAGTELILSKELKKAAPAVFRIDPSSITLSTRGSVHFGYYLLEGVLK